MVHTESRDHTFRGQTQYNRVNRLERHGVFHAQTNEIADREKASIIDFLVRCSPKSQCIRLIGKQLVEQNKRRRHTFSAIEQTDIPIHEALHFGRARVQRPKSFFHGFAVLSPLPWGFRWSGSGRRNLCNRCQDSLKLQPGWCIGSDNALQTILAISEKSSVGPRCNRQGEIEVVQEESTASVGKPQFARFQRLRVWSAENR